MPTQDYKLKDGTPVPGNTTVINSNLGWSKGGLMYWAWAQGKAGKDFRQERDAAADAGTICHAMVEADIKDRTYICPEVDKEIKDKAETGLLNYLEWKRMVNFQPLGMEIAVVSERWRYGTTIDIPAIVAGLRAIVEVKTSNDIYEDFLIQLAAQKEAWNENYPDKKIEKLCLLKLNKEEAAFSYHSWDASALDKAFNAFVCLLELHQLKKELKKLK